MIEVKYSDSKVTIWKDGLILVHSINAPYRSLEILTRIRDDIDHAIEKAREIL